MGVLRAEVIKKAEELEALIRESPESIRYLTSLEKMRSDTEAQELLSKLILFGRELHEKNLKGEMPSSCDPESMEEFKQRVEANPLVREHTEAQKAYVGLIKKVIETIENRIRG